MVSPSIKEIKTYLLLGLIPKRLFPLGIDKISTRNFRVHLSKFELGDDGGLFLKKKNTRIQILEDNSSERFSAFENVHNALHMPFRRTLQKLKQRYYWSGMMDDAKQWTDSCKICQENRKNNALVLSLVLTDHCYSFMNKDTEGLLSLNGCASLSTNQVIVENKETASKKSDEKLVASSHQQFSDARNADKTSTDLDWDHDYVADTLTQERKLQALKESRCLAEQEESKLDDNVDMDEIPASCNMDENINTSTLEWVSLNYEIKPDISFIPDDYLQFLSSLGLETVVNYQTNTRLDAPVTLPHTCLRCKTDCSPSWMKCSRNNVMCTSCYKHLKNAERASSTFLHFQKYLKKCTAEVKEKKRRRATSRRAPFTEISEALERKRSMEGLLRRLALQHKTNRSQFLNPPKSCINTKRNNFYLQMQLLNARRKNNVVKPKTSSILGCRSNNTLVHSSSNEVQLPKQNITPLRSNPNALSFKPRLIGQATILNQRRHPLIKGNPANKCSQISQQEFNTQTKMFRFPSIVIRTKANVPQATGNENSRRHIIQTVKLKKFLVARKVQR